MDTKIPVQNLYRIDGFPGTINMEKYEKVPPKRFKWKRSGTRSKINTSSCLIAKFRAI